MKNLKLLILLLVAAAILPLKTFAVSDKEEKAEVTYLVSMTCESCKNRIENSVSFLKGVTKLNVNLPKKLVTVEYRTDKTTPAKIKKAIEKLGYTATPFKNPKEDKGGEKQE